MIPVGFKQGPEVQFRTKQGQGSSQIEYPLGSDPGFLPLAEYLREHGLYNVNFLQIPLKSDLNLPM